MKIVLSLSVSDFPVLVKLPRHNGTDIGTVQRSHKRDTAITIQTHKGLQQGIKDFLSRFHRAHFLSNSDKGNSETNSRYKSERNEKSCLSTRTRYSLKVYGSTCRSRRDTAKNAGKVENV